MDQGPTLVTLLIGIKDPKFGYENGISNINEKNILYYVPGEGLDKGGLPHKFG